GSAKTDTITLMTGGQLVLKAVESVVGSSGSDQVTLATAGTLVVAGVETVIGSSGADTITITGTTAAVIRGGGGADKLTGGSGSNRFRYTAAAESSPTAKDTLTNFSVSRDVIEILASLRSGSGDGTFIGSTAFSGKGACQIRFNDSSKLLEIDLDGKSTKKAEMAFTLTGVKLDDLKASNSWLSWSG
ncbi:MAG: M10 family metallopeptidase C-terminal domain-containing protein, partial [Magnetococcales bacterium]|nr:M10 family metallopeptidase C-terminal domain-containing protein [Magnetococcales bacterium]